MQNNLGRPPWALVWLYRSSAMVRRAVAAEARQMRSVAELFLPEPTAGVQLGYDRMFSDLRTLRSEAAADGVGLVVLVLPMRSQLAASPPPPRPQETIAAFCRSEGIPYLDALPALRAAAPPAFLDEDHLTPAGMRAVAEHVLASGRLDAWLPEAPAPAAGARSLAELVHALDDPAPAVRAAAAAALEKQGAAARTAGPPLLARLADPDENVRLRAADALVSIGPSPEWLAPLQTLLAHEAGSVRAAAARVVAAMGPAAADAVDSLVAALEPPDEAVAAEVAQALGRIGPLARPGAPALVVIAARPGAARLRAIEALGLIRAEAAVTPLCGALADSSAEVRWQAARALGRIGAASSGCADALLRGLQDASADVRMAAVRALPRIGVERGRLAAALEKLKDDPDGDVRTEVARALRRLRR
jgi:HEAT repeat protein